MSHRQLINLARRFDAVVKEADFGQYIVQVGAMAPVLAASAEEAADLIRELSFQSLTHGSVF